MGSSSTTNQTQDQTTHATITPTNPPWVSSLLEGLGGKVGDLGNADPYSFVAGPSALQTQAGDNASKLNGLPWQYNGATDLTNGVAQANAPSILGHMNEFMTPYLNDVIKTSMANFDQNAALTNEQNKLGLANDTTFGGSGGAITDALTKGQLALDRGTLLANLRNTGYSQALQGATAQAGLDQAQTAQRLAAAAQLGQIANDYQGNLRSNIATQGSVGSILQGLDQARAGAPLTVASSLAADSGALPLGLLHGQIDDSQSHGTSTSTTSQSNPLGTIGSLAMLAAAPFTGGASLMGGLGGLGAIGSGLGSLASMGSGMSGLGGLISGIGNIAHNDPTGMWRFG